MKKTDAAWEKGRGQPVPLKERWRHAKVAGVIAHLPNPVVGAGGARYSRWSHRARTGPAPREERGGR